MPRKVSLITTVYNEEQTIGSLLDSIIAQQRQPDEFIIVDAGSTDSTRDIISDYASRGLSVKLIEEPGASRAYGRNVAIAQATGEIIASIDAGCVAEPDWLAQLVAPFSESSPPDVVSGYYTPEAVTTLEQAIAVATVPPASVVSAATFLPSSRSIAFWRSVWQLAHGYPEYLEYAEDTLFDLDLKRVGCRFRFHPVARVRWRMASTLPAVYRQFRNYARSDGELGHWFGHYQKAFTLPIAVLIALLLTLMNRWFSFSFLLFMGVYWLRYFLRARRRGAEKKIAALAPLVNLMVDLAHVSGYTVGHFRRRPMPPPLPANRPLSFAQVTYTYQPIMGGADVYAQQLADMITAAGHQHVVYQRRADTDASNVRFVPNPFYGKPFEFWTQTLGLFRLWRQLMTHDVVICHYPPYLLAIYLMSLFTRGPVRVAISHGVFWDDKPQAFFSRLKARVTRLAFTRAHLYIANDTNFLRAMGIRIKPKHRMHREIGPGVWFIPNGVDIAVFHATPPIQEMRTMNAILVVRNFFRNRGLHLAIQAFDLFHREHADTTLVIIGGGGEPGYLEELQEDVERRELTNAVIFSSSVPHEQLPAIYSSARLNLVPSLCGEGTSLSALESMACGTATICTSVAGLLDLPGPHSDPEPTFFAEVMRLVYLKRLATGDEQRRLVTSYYSLAQWRRSWRHAFSTVGVRMEVKQQSELPME